MLLAGAIVLGASSAVAAESTAPSWHWQGTRASLPEPAYTALLATADWRTLVQAGPAAQLDRWRASITAMLPGVSASPEAKADFAALQQLLAAPLQRVDASSLTGEWRCRSIQVSAGGVYGYPDFRCRIGDTTSGTRVFEKLNGSQRRSGIFYTDHDPQRLILLGGATVNDSAELPFSTAAVSEDAGRATVGILQQLAADHVLMVFDVEPDSFEVYDLHRRAPRSP